MTFTLTPGDVAVIIAIISPIAVWGFRLEASMKALATQRNDDQRIAEQTRRSDLVLLEERRQSDKREQTLQLSQINEKLGDIKSGLEDMAGMQRTVDRLASQLGVPAHE